MKMKRIFIGLLLVLSTTANAAWQRITPAYNVTNIENVAYTQWNAPPNQWYLAARWMGADIISLPTDYYAGLHTGFDPSPRIGFQLGNRGSGLPQSTVQAQGTEGGALFRTWDSPLTGFTKHYHWGFTYDEGTYPPLWQTSSEDFMVQATLKLPNWSPLDYVEQCECAGEGLDAPLGQYYFALRFVDNTNPEEVVQMTVSVFDSREGYSAEAVGVDVNGYPFATTYVGSDKYVTTPPQTGGVLRNTPWNDWVFFRAVITAQDFTEALIDMNAKRVEAGGGAISEDAADYSLRMFGIIAELRYSEGDEAVFGVSWKDVGAWRQLQ